MIRIVHKILWILFICILLSCKKSIDNNNEHKKTSTATDSVVGRMLSGKATLEVISHGADNYGVRLTIGDSTTAYQQTFPLVAEIVSSSGSAKWIDTCYSTFKRTDSSLQCSGILLSDNGSRFLFTDNYFVLTAATFRVSRTVKVLKVGQNDVGFATRMAFHRGVKSTMGDYDFFAPSIWYKNNAYVPSTALASNMNDNYYWFREDRMPLPIFLLRLKTDGTTFSVCNLDPDGSTYKQEDGLDRIIDPRLKFASLGMENKNQPLVGMLFPGSEGEKTGVFGMSAQSGRWAYRNNPVSLNFEQHYEMAISLTKTPDYVTAMKGAWEKYFELADVKIYKCNLEQVYNDQIDLLKRYWKSINGVPGFPFRIMLNGQIENESDYNFDMGFVGKQIPNAALLIRAGLQSGNAELVSKGEKIADWWALNAIGSNGAVRTWYDPIPGTWRSYETYLRTYSEGLDGLLFCWNLEKRRGIDKPLWLAACQNAAAWILTFQNADGSFPRSIDHIGNMVRDGNKNNTSHVIPFLVDMYKFTGNDLYKDAALKAGAFNYMDAYLNFKYVGGTPDNPNIPDREAASMELRAALALYDLTQDQKWLDEAMQAAYYYQTWIYSWNVPIPMDDQLASYPKNRTTTGLGVIATGGNGADVGAAYDCFNFYRLYLYSADPQMLALARLCLNNTKQAVNWDRADPIPGYGGFGILTEAMNVTIPRGHSVNYYLPWEAYNYLEPMVLLKDVFGDMDIEKIQSLSLPDRKRMNKEYAASRDF